jgi:Pentapeptide repeats (8 copies)
MVQVTLTNADLTPSQHGAESASLTAACMQQAALDGTKLYSANLSDAVITNTMGSIVEQHYGEDGTITQPSTMHYRPGKFPDAASFSDETICPNRDTYKDNKQRGLDIPQMMQTKNPSPAKWTPKQTMPNASSPPGRS